MFRGSDFNSDLHWRCRSLMPFKKIHLAVNLPIWNLNFQFLFYHSQLFFLFLSFSQWIPSPKCSFLFVRMGTRIVNASLRFAIIMMNNCMCELSFGSLSLSSNWSVVFTQPFVIAVNCRLRKLNGMTCEQIYTIKCLVMQCPMLFYCGFTNQFHVSFSSNSHFFLLGKYCQLCNDNHFKLFSLFYFLLHR